MKVLLALLALGIVTLTGCKTTPPAVTKAYVRTGVQLGVAFGVEQAPEAIPYLRYAAPVVCEAARGTNLSPAFVIGQLENNAQAEQFKNQQAKLIFNSAFALYSGLYQSFGAEAVANQLLLQAWLEGTCEGILAGLPSVTPAATLTRAKPLPPHLR